MIRVRISVKVGVRVWVRVCLLQVRISFSMVSVCNKLPRSSCHWRRLSSSTNTSVKPKCSDLLLALIDDEAPVLTCSSDIIAYTLPGLPYAVIVISSPNATDNSISGTQLGNDSIYDVDIGSFIFTFEAEDLAGNQGNCSLTITVLGEYVH